MRILVKYGGNALGAVAGDPLLRECAELHRLGTQLVLVHGGGPQIDAALAELGLGKERVAGLRVTDARSLAVVERTLCGTVNKSLVRGLAAAGAAAVGISGIDGGTLIARKLERADGADLGFVGEVVRCDTRAIHALLNAGFIPVVAPLAAGDGGQVFNVNADTAAGALAGALAVDAYLAVTDVTAVRRDAADPASAIRTMSAGEAAELHRAGAFPGGMGPKVEAALAAVFAGAARTIICSASGGIAGALAGKHGTEITT